MNIKFVTLLLVTLFLLMAKQSKAVNGDGSGTITIVNSEVGFSSDTTYFFSESFYLGPNTIWEIDGVVVIYAKNVWISPGAQLSGTGKMILANPGDNPYWDDMPASATIVDGNNNSNYIDVLVELTNPNGITIAGITDPGYATESTSNNSLRIGANLVLSVDGANVQLDNTVQGDLIMDGDAALVNYSDKRMVITNNSTLSHLVKEGYTGSFVFPVGTDNSNTNAAYYSPVNVNTSTSNTVYVSVQNFSGSATNETSLRSKGVGLTWHIYAASALSATLTTQHNTTLNGTIAGGGILPYSDAPAGLVKGGTTWSTYTSFTYSMANGNLQYSGADMANAIAHNESFVLTTSPSADASHYTLDVKNDLDTDDDGITNVNEGEGYDPFSDCDGDGILNYKDPTPGCTTLSGTDPWGRAYQAISWADCNGDSVNDFFDTDRDGVPDALDLDSDNDGILDVQEARPGSVAVANTNGMVTGTDTDGNGILSQADNGNSDPVLNGLQAQDLDKDLIPSFQDLDSDGDGVTDKSEARATYDGDGIENTADTDGDGVRGEVFLSNSATTIDNIDGMGAKGLTLIDTDGDGYPNVFDIDSDNDGITDNTELQATCSNQLPLGTDGDGDGVDDKYDIAASCTPASAGLTPFDKDGDAAPDYLDNDTDNDGVPDIYEGNNIYNVPNYWASATGDADKDGLIDYFDGYNITDNNLTYWYNVFTNNLGNNGSIVTPAGLVGGSIVQLPEDAGLGCSGGGERNFRNAAILPVTLVSFTGSINNALVTLNWNVTAEVNMSHYEIERSLDGTNFNKLGSVQSKNAVTSQDYTTTDDVRNLQKLTVYYRLKMVDKNGKWAYSHVISFRLGDVKGMFSMYPNPAKNMLTLNIPSQQSGVAEIELYTITGSRVVQTRFSVLQGNNTITLREIATLPSGTYTVRVMVGKENYVAKLVIANER